ncbi:hypothetical protein Bca101_064851 [Brassica carinata]
MRRTHLVRSILLTSMIGVSAPLFSRHVPFLHPHGNTFTIVKAFASGIILETSFMHVLSDSFEMLSSECLEDDPWHKLPFTGFVAMLSGLVTLAIDSMATSFYSCKTGSEIVPAASNGDQERANPMITHGHSHGHGVLELGIIVHSVVIGLSLGATNDTCTIKGLIAALCFHQMFEGMGLGGCILQMTKLK